MATLPLCSLTVGDDGQVQITSTVMVHEGVWWHRAELVAVMAALQLNCAETVRAALELEGIALDTTSPFFCTGPAEQGPAEGFDPIYDVVPDLRTWPLTRTCPSPTSSASPRHGCWNVPSASSSASWTRSPMCSLSSTTTTTTADGTRLSVRRWSCSNPSTTRLPESR